MSEPIVYLTTDQVHDLHRRALDEFGGLDGIRSAEQLLSAVRQVEQSAFGQDAYPTIPEKAAAYAFFIAESQAYLDGNKRTAAAAMLTFLAINNHGFDQTDDEIAVAIIDLGQRVIGRSEFFDWACKHAVPASEDVG
jgi:death-on-curing protein